MLFSVAFIETSDWVSNVIFYASAPAAAWDWASFCSTRGEVGLFGIFSRFAVAAGVVAVAAALLVDLLVLVVGVRVVL